MNVTKISNGNYLSACSNPFIISRNGTGIVDVDVVCLGQAVSSGTILGTITFQAMSVGNSSLKLENARISVGNGTDVPLIKVDGVLRITSKAGDANGDSEVSYNDLIILAASYGKTQTQAGFDIRADFNGDGKIDYSDLLLIAANYGT